jgi:hypothetical protein
MSSVFWEKGDSCSCRLVSELLFVVAAVLKIVIISRGYIKSFTTTKYRIFIKHPLSRVIQYIDIYSCSHEFDNMHRIDQKNLILSF